MRSISIGYSMGVAHWPTMEGCILFGRARQTDPKEGRLLGEWSPLRIPVWQWLAEMVLQLTPIGWVCNGHLFNRCLSVLLATKLAFIG